MANGFFPVPIPQNEPVLSYGPGSPEKKALKAKLSELKSQSGNFGECRCPHQHGHVLATYHKAETKEVEMAIQAAREAWPGWAALPWEARAAIFLKAADLLAGPFRSTLNAATMLGQSKTVFQAEIDSACELIDFYRYNPYYMQQIYQQQPDSSRGCWNYVEQRPLEGFILAVTPFNFTSIAGNLPTAPAMMGNTVIWKPASSAVFAAYYIMQLLKAAGLPDGRQ
jgi:1-pyrroline-5-carboxylate dehydrogenase